MAKKVKSTGIVCVLSFEVFKCVAEILAASCLLPEDDAFMLAIFK